MGVHLYLQDANGRVLLGLRHPDSVYAGRLWHTLAGHCEREDAVSSLIRETEEEAGLLLDREAIDLVHLVHSQVFFRARSWSGCRRCGTGPARGMAVVQPQGPAGQHRAVHPTGDRGDPGGPTVLRHGVDLMTRTRTTSPFTGTVPGLAPGAPVAVAVAARVSMVARLEAACRLRPGPVREALLSLRREVLIPQAHVGRSAPGVEPPRWECSTAGSRAWAGTRVRGQEG
ncbi:NUDIX domain-containing protein [Streptomyces rubiginosohelvolus]|uniref:NUDIX domain-containing protein n=1 Tax=Streptomyces rubiginosohelvolus TaxID=67362 RepID=UPI00367A1BCB